MSSRRKNLDTSLFRARETIDQESSDNSGDMSPERDMSEKRASFDLYTYQTEALGILKYRTGKKISDLAKEAMDDLLSKYGMQ